jgi:hypothetical protein
MASRLHQLERGLAVATVAMAAIAACSTNTPPPSPERSPSPTLPSCITDADCTGGEECRDGVCARPGLDGRPQRCARGCPSGAICVDGACVASAAGDGGLRDSCGGCPDATECNVDTKRCELLGAATEPGSREIPEPRLRGPNPAAEDED